MNTPTPINDPRLTPEMERVRSGSKQLFRKRYGDNKFTSSENADVVLTPPEKHLYAKLIDNVWHWVNGCAECNGQPRDWMTYIECDKHNVCRTCKTPRSQLTETPWGGKHGWKCQPCANAEHEAEKELALAAMPEEHDELDYRHDYMPRCPYCDLEFEVGSDEIDGMLGVEEERVCERCDHTFSIEAEMSITYSTARI